MCAFGVALPDPRPGLGDPEEWLGPGSLLADGVAIVSQPLPVICWMARASVLESANIDCHSGRREVRHRTRMHTRRCTYAAKLVKSHATSRAYGTGCISIYLRLCLYISGCTYISPAVLIYLRLYIYIYPAVLIYLRLYLHISGCTCISAAVLIYLRLYLYISGCTYISLAWYLCL